MASAKVGSPITGLVTLAFRSLNSLMRLFVQKLRGFCRLATSGASAGYRTHTWTGDINIR
jgi:hypothetical protein